jgi:hypothetical protein
VGVGGEEEEVLLLAPVLGALCKVTGDMANSSWGRERAGRVSSGV